MHRTKLSTSVRSLRADRNAHLKYAVLFFALGGYLGMYWFTQYTNNQSNKLLFLFFSVVSLVYGLVCLISALDKQRLLHFINNPRVTLL